MKIRYKIADVETAGFAGPDEISTGVCEVAWLEIDEELNVLRSFSSLVNPGRQIEEGAREAHGITDAEVAFAPQLKTLYAQHWNDAPTVVIAHNKNFDLKFLSPYIQVLYDSLCTLELARQYFPKAPNHKLGTLADYLGLEKGTAHRAAGDVVTTLNLLRAVVASTGRTLPELIKLGRKPKVLTVMPFGEHKGKAFHDIPAGYLNWILQRKDDMPQDVVFSAQTAMNMR